MSALDTEVHNVSRTRVGTTRRRALVALVGLGVLAAVPLTMGAAVDGVGLNRGDKVTPGKKTPAIIKTALRSSGPVVVAFLLPGITEDEIVQKRLTALQREGSFKDTRFIVYRITPKTRLGDLPTMFNIKYTPAVAVIQGDDKLSNVWRGLVDGDIIAQSLLDARGAIPRPVAVAPRKGGVSGARAGIALARRVNASYAKVPGISVTYQGSLGGVADAQGTGQIRLVDGRQRLASLTAQGASGSATVVLNATGLYTKLGTALCWTRSTSPRAVASLGDKAIPLAGRRFTKPVKSKNGATLSLVATDLRNQYGGGNTTYTIDAKTFQVTTATTGASTAGYTALPKAPVIARPDKLC